MTSALYRNTDGSIAQDITDLGTAFVSVQISGGAITYTGSLMTIDTEGYAAADDLTTIADGGTGKLLIMRPANPARVITLKHGIGNLHCPSGADVVLDDPNGLAILVYTGSVWTVFHTCCDAKANTIPPGASTGETVACVAAARARAFIAYLVDTIKSQFANGSVAMAAALFPAIQLVRNTSAVTPQIWELIGWFAANFTNAAAITAEFDTNAYDYLQCVIEFGDTNKNGLYTAAELSTMQFLIGASAILHRTAFLKILTILQAVGLNNAQLTSVVENSPLDCDTCGGILNLTWCYEFDFTASNGGWYLNNPPDRGVYGSGGWDANTNYEGAANNIAVQIRKDFSATLTAIEVEYDVDGSAYRGMIAYFDSTTFINVQGGNGSGQATGWLGSGVAVTYLAVQLVADYAVAPGVPVGSGTIKKIKLSGTGTNPFGSDNC